MKRAILGTQTALDDAQEYLKVLTARYKCPDNQDILFVTNYKGYMRKLLLMQYKKAYREIY